MSDSFDKVAEFNTSFGNSVRTAPGLHYEDIKMRHGLLKEEASEVDTAMTRYEFLPEIQEVLEEIELPADVVGLIIDKLTERIHVEFLDGLADTLVVLHGLAQGTGMPIMEAFDAVHESNMSKLNPDGTVLRREDGKTLKGENYFAPTEKLKEILGHA